MPRKKTAVKPRETGSEEKSETLTWKSLNDKLDKFMDVVLERLDNTQVESVSRKELDLSVDRSPVNIPVPEGNEDVVVFVSPWFQHRVIIEKSKRVNAGANGEFYIEPPVIAEFQNGVLSVPVDRMVGDKSMVSLLRGILEECARNQTRPDFVEVKEGETVEFASKALRKPTPDAMGEWSSPLRLPDIPQPPPEAQETLDHQQKVKEGKRSLRAS